MNQAAMLTERYKRTGAVKDLEIATAMAEQAINTTKPEHPDLVDMFFKLSVMRGLRYEQNGDIDDLNRAVEAAENVVAATPSDHPEMAARFSNLGIRLCRKFDKTGDMADINRAITLTDIAVNATPIDDPRRASRLNNLSHLLDSRFRRTYEINDINQAIEITQIALDATPADHEDHALILNTLGTMHMSRFEKIGTTEDFTKAVRFTKEAVEATPLQSPKRSLRIHNLQTLISRPVTMPDTIEHLDSLIEVSGIAIEIAPIIQGDVSSALSTLAKLLMERFERSGMLDDINRAVDTIEKALDVASPDSPDISDLLRDLGNSLGARFQRTGVLEDVNRAVESMEMAVQTTSPDSSAWASCLANLGNWLGFRFKHTGSIKDINRAVDVCEIALDMGGTHHPDRPALLITLGTWLARRYQKNGTMEDLHRSVKVSEEAINAAPREHPDRPKLALNLANRLGRQFENMGTVEVLNRAIELISTSVDGISPGSHHRADSFNNLGLWLGTRFERSGAMEDIDEAVKAAVISVDITPLDHPQRPERLSTLGKLHAMRFRRTKDKKDLDRAIEALETAMAATSKSADQAIIISHLGICHRSRFEHSGEIKDLNTAISMMFSALKSNSLEHSDKPAFLYNLGAFLGRRYTLTGDTNDLNRGIEIVDMELVISPIDLAHRADSYNNLGRLLTWRFEQTGVIDDFVRAESSFRNGWESHNAPPLARIRIAENLAVNLAKQFRWKEASTLLQEAVRLLPALSPRSLQNTDKQHMLANFFGIASMAAAVALNAGEKPSEALELLELGRGVVAGLTLEMRTDISELDRKHPELAKEFVSLRDKLDAPIAQSTLSVRDDTATTRELRAKSRREAEERFGQLIKEIRTRHGFKTFLRPTAEQFMAAADPGPIVIVNVSHYRCDAFIVKCDEIVALNLPYLTLEDIERNTTLLRVGDELETWKVLEWMWEVVTRPILEALDIKTSPTDGNWPHIWWIPTGQLCQLPIHAAGRYIDGSSETVLDRVISSYSLSIKALVYGRQTPVVKSGKSDDALLVSMPNTVDQSPLHFAQQEVDMLEELCPSMGLNPVKPLRRQQENVLMHLTTCKIFHFAGHGHSDSSDPLRSCLLLDDWRTHPLTVAELREHKLQERPPFLAYLSACSTGANDAVEFADEGIHLIGACQLAGFRHVVGALWEVNDLMCVDVARRLYETIRDEGMTDRAICLGLHRAVRALRDECLESSFLREFQSPMETKVVTAKGDLSKSLEDTETSSAMEASDVQDSDDRESLPAKMNRSLARDGDVQNISEGIDDSAITSSGVNEGEESQRGMPTGRTPVVFRLDSQALYWMPYIHFGV